MNFSFGNVKPMNTIEAYNFKAKLTYFLINSFLLFSSGARSLIDSIDFLLPHHYFMFCYFHPLPMMCKGLKWLFIYSSESHVPNIKIKMQ